MTSRHHCEKKLALNWSGNILEPSFLSNNLRILLPTFFYILYFSVYLYIETRFRRNVWDCAYTYGTSANTRHSQASFRRICHSAIHPSPIHRPTVPKRASDAARRGGRKSRDLDAEIFACNPLRSNLRCWASLI